MPAATPMSGFDDVKTFAPLGSGSPKLQIKEPLASIDVDLAPALPAPDKRLVGRKKKEKGAPKAPYNKKRKKKRGEPASPPTKLLKPKRAYRKRIAAPAD